MKRSIRNLLLGIAGVIIVFVVISSTDIGAVSGVLVNTNLYFLFCAVLVQLLSYFFLVSKIRKIACKYKRISYFVSFRLWLSGALLDLVTPFIQIGGEPIKILILKKNGWKTSKASAVIITDTFLELFAFFTMLVIAILFLVLTSDSNAATASYFIGIAVAALMIFSMFYVALNIKILKRVISKIDGIVNIFSHKKKYKHAIKSYTDFVYSFEKSFRQLLRSERLMAETFFLSLGAKLLDFVRIYFVFLAIGFPLGIHTIIFVWAIILIFSMLPGLPGNLGIVEAGGIAAYVLFGVPAPIAATAVLLDRAISFWMLLAIGGVAGFKKTEHHS